MRQRCRYDFSLLLRREHHVGDGGGSAPLRQLRRGIKTRSRHADHAMLLLQLCETPNRKGEES
jgi:hypothetical protein